MEELFNWTLLLNLTYCEDMVNCFYNTVLPLLDHFMPWVKRAQHTTEKPWISNHFRQLIKRRQQALKQGQLLQYKRLCNKTMSVARRLRERQSVHPSGQCPLTRRVTNLKTQLQYFVDFPLE